MKPFSILFILVIIASITILNIGTGCAVQIPPSGGARDSLPPIMEKAWPADSTKNFRASKITLAFNEYVSVDNAQQNVIVSPLPKTNPIITHKLNEITVKLRDSLESNTTYAINFGNSIKDVNEGNIYKNYTYIFTTGTTLDASRIQGKVIQAATGEPDSTLIVMLHIKGEDSAVMKEKPRYATRTDGAGRFVFTNLPPRTFYVYALKDNGMYRYISTSQDFAFLDASVTAGSATDSLTLYAFTRDDGKKQSAAATPTRATRPADKRLKFTINLNNGKLNVTKPLEIAFETPLRIFDTTKISLFTDSTFTPLKAYTWVKDSTVSKVQLSTSWVENKQYHIIIEKDFAIDTFNRQLFKKDTLSFITMGRDDYAGVKLRFKNLNTIKNPLLQLFEGTAIIDSFPLTGETFIKNYLPPGEFTMRIVSDANNNGRWDTGNFFKGHLQPERVFTLPRKLSLKAGRVEEFEVALP